METTSPTPQERIEAGEIVRFVELSAADMAALFPHFSEIWLRSQQITQPVEGQVAA